MQLAVINKEKCRPTLCGHECKKYCPVEKKEADSCINIDAKAVIDENTCIGCKICVKRCPFGAIDIINLPSVSEKDMVHRYGENGFALYGIPTPSQGGVLGLLGRNGIGKTTTVKILSGQEKMNFGVFDSEVDWRSRFRGNELMKYFEELGEKKVSYKPQNLSALSVDISVIELLKKRGNEEKIKEYALKLGLSNVLENKMDKLSGGELQRVAIIAASLGDADIYFFDEPLAYLDIGQRLIVSDFIKEVGIGKTVVVVEHDLLILDYLTDNLNIFYGGQGSFGLVSGIKTAKYGVNSYLSGFLKEENLRIRDKGLNFNFTRNAAMRGNEIGAWDDFNIRFGDGGSSSGDSDSHPNTLLKQSSHPKLGDSASRKFGKSESDDSSNAGSANRKGFELQVKAGKIYQNNVVGILGKNGTGKTTFVRALVGEIETDKGKIDLRLDVSYKAQYLFSESEENVRDICFKEKINKKMMSTFNLGVLQDKKLNELSGGELQRFSIARCLAKDADIYFIDEPSAYLDVEERISVAKAIKDLMVEKERTAFVVDHDLLLISYLADSIINFDGEGGVKGVASSIKGFEEGVTELLKSLDITLRKDEESGRPRINKKGSVLDRGQKEKGKWVVL